MQCCGNTRLFQLDHIFRKEKNRSTFCKQLLNASLMSSLCPVFLIFPVFLLYRDAKPHNKQEQNALLGSWLISDLIWLFSENGLGIAKLPGGDKKRREKKDPTLPFAYFHTVIPFSFFPQPHIFVVRTSGLSALVPCVRCLLSFHT